MNIGNAIAEQRARKNMSQQELADSLHMSRDLVSKWENNLRRPDYGMIEQIADVFGISADEITDRNDLVFEELSECAPQEIEIAEDALTDCLNRFLLKLTKRNADLFMMRYYFLKSTADIAKEFGMGENHVRSRLSKIRGKLKAFLKEELQ